MKTKSKKLLITSLLLSSCLLAGGVGVVNHVLSDNNHTNVQFVSPEVVNMKALATNNEVVTDFGVSLSEDIVVNVTVADAENRYVTFKLDGVNEPTKVEESENGVFSYDKVTPQYLDKNVVVTVHNKADDAQVGTYSTSVRQYLQDTVNNSTETTDFGKYAERALAVDLINLGAAAQTYTDTVTGMSTFGIDTTDVYEFERLGSPIDKLVRNDDMWVAANLGFNSSVNVSFAFTLDEGTSLEGLSVKVTLEGKETSIPSSEFVKATSHSFTGKDVYKVTYEDVSATYFDKVITAQVMNGETPVGGTVEYSVNSYIARSKSSSNTELVSLAKAAFCYGKSAVRYANRDVEGLENIKANFDNAVDVSANQVFSAYGGVIFDFDRNSFIVNMDDRPSSAVSLNSYSLEGIGIVLNIRSDMGMEQLNHTNSALSPLTIEGDGKLSLSLHIQTSAPLLTIRNNVDLKGNWYFQKGIFLENNASVENASTTLHVSKTGNLTIEANEYSNAQGGFTGIEHRNVINEGTINLLNCNKGVYNANVINHGTLHLQSNEWGIEGNSLTLQFKSGSTALFEKINGQGYASFCMNDYSKFVAEEGAKIGVKGYSCIYYAPNWTTFNGSVENDQIVYQHNLQNIGVNVNVDGTSGNLYQWVSEETTFNEMFGI